MSVKVVTLLKKVDSLMHRENAAVIIDFHNYMREKGLSENHIINNLKVVIEYVNYLNEISFYEVDKKEHILRFLNIKIKNESIDPEKRWITTWNHYLNRLKLFFRWLHNYHKNINQISVTSYDVITNEDWITPDFIKIKQRQTKRNSPYLETEIWELEELLTIIKYEPISRNKAIISLLWDLDARPHEVTLLKIKHIRLKEKYGEGEIPHQAKTGSGPILLTISFPYVRDWLNEHPFRNESEARLICNLYNGSPLNPKSIWNMMEQLKRRIIRLLEDGEKIDDNERHELEYLLKTKKWNPYCIRHSAITADSDYLPEYALKKKVRWSMNSKQGSRYIKNRMGDALRNKILEQNDIRIDAELRPKPTNTLCPKCELVNQIENKYCSKCSYPLTPQSFEEIKNEEDAKFKALEEKQSKQLEDMQQKLQKILEYVDFNKIKQ
jgi:integrase